MSQIDYHSCWVKKRPVYSSYRVRVHNLGLTTVEGRQQNVSKSEPFTDTKDESKAKLSSLSILITSELELLSVR